MIPGTLGQVLAIVLLVLPGFVFTAVKARRRGPTPADGDSTQRVLTSIVIGAVLNGFYVLVGGRLVTDLFSTSRAADRWHDHPRVVTAVALGLLVLVPAILAVVDDKRESGRWEPIEIWSGKRVSLRYVGRYDPIPSAWDYAGPPRGASFIRVRMPDGSWTGGWFGPESFLSTWPEPHDIFIESQWRMDSEGEFKQRVGGTRGVYVSCPEGVVVEWIAPPGAPDAAPEEAPE